MELKNSPGGVIHWQLKTAFYKRRSCALLNYAELRVLYIMAVTNLSAFGGLRFKNCVVIPPVAGLNYAEPGRSVLARP